MDTNELVHVRCQCDSANAVSIVVTDDGRGFEPNAVPDLLAGENLKAERGRGIHLMRLGMDEVFFEDGGTQVGSGMSYGRATK